MSGSTTMYRTAKLESQSMTNFKIGIASVTLTWKVVWKESIAHPQSILKFCPRCCQQYWSQWQRARGQYLTTLFNNMTSIRHTLCLRKYEEEPIQNTLQQAWAAWQLAISLNCERFCSNVVLSSLDLHKIQVILSFLNFFANNRKKNIYCNLAPLRVIFVS